MVTTAFIQINDAVFGYTHKGRHKEILRVPNLTIEGSNFYGIIGSNGSGKSTFLRSICGLQPLLSGQIVINGMSIDSIAKPQLAEQLAIVLTSRVGGFNLKVLDAIQSARMPFTNWHNSLQNEDIIAVNDAITTVGIEDIVDVPLNELSDGMFQKTMIARALAQQSKGIALDEPSAYLDYASKHRTFLLLQLLSQESQKCILASSHDLDLLLKYAGSLLLIENGCVRPMAIDAARTDAGFRALSGDFL